MKNQKFKFPKIDNSKEYPFWNKDHFIVDGKKHDILVYNKTTAGWNESLTVLHEEAIGSNHPIDITSRNLTINLLSKFCKKEDNILLEIGTSSGYMINDINNVLPNNFIIGSDIIPNKLKKVSKENPSIPFICFDLLKCPIESESVDVIVMLNVLEHIKNDDLALQVLFSILKKDGKLLIEVPANQKLYDDYDLKLKHFRRYESIELIRKLKKTGFKIKKKTAVGFFTYPAFYLVKKLNRIFNKNISVENQAIKSKSSFVINILFKIERYLSSYINYPCGIRIYIVAEK